MREGAARCAKCLDYATEIRVRCAEHSTDREIAHWRKKWEDLETNRSVCCMKMEEALERIALFECYNECGTEPDCPVCIARQALEGLCK